MECLVQDDGFVDFLGDGSADLPEQSRWRVAGSGFVWQLRNRTWKEWSSPFGGPVQTITRAELMPLVELLENTDFDARWFVDNRSVFLEASERLKIAQAARDGVSCSVSERLKKPIVSLPNGDLWLRFTNALCIDVRRVCFVKVKSALRPGSGYLLSD